MSNIDANEVENEEAAPAKSKGVQLYHRQDG